MSIIITILVDILILIILGMILNKTIQTASKNKVSSIEAEASALLERSKKEADATKKESIWHINNLRDFRIDYNTSIWNKNILDLQSNYFIDKIINSDSISYIKPWHQLESFRDKFLVVRYLFDKFSLN